MFIQDRRKWRAGDHLINRSDRRQAQVHSLEIAATLVLSGGGVLVGKQVVLEKAGWELLRTADLPEDTEMPFSSH